MKYHLRVPTTEQYAYIEAEYEGDSAGAVDEYLFLTALVGRQKNGLPEREMCKVYDEYMATGSIPGGAELYEKMNATQKIEIQALKRSLKRTKQ